ncbi:MAG: hypothetical protein J0H40_17185 [Rhizobiales bacterium]|nr:hypothetical protein [Hyphomicrobiales bacterium]
MASGPLEGHASVVDGDAIEVHGQRIRLAGIDAPKAISFAGTPIGDYSSG